MRVESLIIYAQESSAVNLTISPYVQYSQVKSHLLIGHPEGSHLISWQNCNSLKCNEVLDYVGHLVL